jgi:hypothetical protein
MDIGATRIVAFPWPVATAIERVAALAFNGGRMAADLLMSAQLHAEELARGFTECFHALEVSARSDDGDDGDDSDDRETADMVAAYVQQSIIAAYANVDSIGGTRHEEINSQNHHATVTYGDAERTSIDKMRLLGEPLQVQAQRYVRCGIVRTHSHVSCSFVSPRVPYARIRAHHPTDRCDAYRCARSLVQPTPQGHRPGLHDQGRAQSASAAPRGEQEEHAQ